MKQNNFEYYQDRVREKIADFERYKFGKQENGRFSKAEVLNILQELIRESTTKEESDSFSKAILLESYGFESCIYYLEEKKNLEDKAVNEVFSDIQRKKSLSEEIKQKIIQEETARSRHDNTQAIFPIRGNTTIKDEIDYPSNQNVIIGALDVKSARPLDEGTLFFLEKYCRRLGVGIHVFDMLAYNKRLNQHILDMLTVATHDIRGPLNSIAVGLKVLDRELYGRLTPSIKNVIQGLYRKADSLSITLETYLGQTSLFSGHIEIRKEKLDYRMDIIDPILEEFSDIFARNRITIDESMGGIPEGSIIISADRIWLLSVYRNLFSNVQRHGGPGCTMAFGFEDWGDHYRLNVFNSGHPLDYTQQEKLFQKFSRLEKQGGSEVKGTGVGLYFAKEIIERHGGKIWYEPKSDGSNFVFTLPKE